MGRGHFEPAVFGEITDAVASLVFPHFGFGGWGRGADETGGGADHRGTGLGANPGSGAGNALRREISRNGIPMSARTSCASGITPGQNGCRPGFAGGVHGGRGQQDHSLPAPRGTSRQVEGEDFCQRFKATLSDKDMAILELRVEGYTFGEIADRLGYKTPAP